MESSNTGLKGAGVYPYLGVYLNVDAHKTQGHVGPSWGYDARLRVFLLPTIMEQNGYPRWRIAPERQGSTDAHRDLGLTLTHLSDWSANKIMQMVASDNAQGAPSSNGQGMEQDVYSILMQASTATELLDKPDGIKVMDIDQLQRCIHPLVPTKLVLNLAPTQEIQTTVQR